MYSLFFFKFLSIIFLSSTVFSVALENSVEIQWKLLHPNGDPPLPRQQHTAVSMKLEDEDVMVVFGGVNDWVYINDLAIYNIVNNTWLHPNPMGDQPCPRRRHTAVVYANKTKMLVFGGLSNELNFLNDLYSYDINTNRWTKIIVEGKKPPGRFSHTSVITSDEKKMLIFGGQYDNGFHHDLWQYDLLNNQWEQINSPNAPVGRVSHSVSIYNEQMLIFGGIEYFGGYEGYLNDLNIFDVEKQEWKPVNHEGIPPSRRGSHKAVIIDQMMVISCGYDILYLNDIHILELGSMKWMETQTPGEPPVGRSSHTAIEYNKSLLIFGGSDGSYNGDLNELYQISFNR